MKNRFFSLVTLCISFFGLGSLQAKPIIIDPLPIGIWGGYAWHNNKGDVNTGDFLGWINVQGAPWVWSYSLSSFVFVDEPAGSESGAWVYFNRPAPLLLELQPKALKLPGGDGGIIIKPIQLYWSGYPWANVSGDVNTSGYIGWINVKDAPWVWSYAFNGFCYLPEPSSGAAGVWGYRNRTAPVPDYIGIY